MKNRILRVLLASILYFGVPAIVLGDCHDTANPRFPYESDTKSCGAGYTTITKRVYKTVYWLDSNLGRPVDVIDTGETSPEYLGCVECWPRFDTPYWEDYGTTATW